MKTLFQWLCKILLCLGFGFFLLGTQPAQCATPIESGETLSGSLSVSEMDTYEFYGEAGDRVLIDADVVSGVHGFDTEIILIDPDFSDEANTQPGGDLLDHVLQKTGTYTILVQDVDKNHTGSYKITLLNLTRGPMNSAGDPDGGPIASGETLSGSLNVSDMDGFQFYGEAGDRILIDADVVSGVHGFDTEIILIDPDFSDEANTQPGGDLLDHVLQKTGTYTIIVQDAGLNHTGSYKITLLNLTRGPTNSAGDPDGGPIASGETLSGSLNVSDMDGFQFYGEVGDRILIDADVVSGVYGFNTEIILIAPDRTTEIDTLTGGDLLDHTLVQTGTYTFIVQDAGLNHTGNYKITLLRMPGATSSPGDFDGGLIPPGETLSGALAVSDMDGFQFYGKVNDRVMINVDVVSGVYGFDTEIILIDPDFLDEVDTKPGGDYLDHNLLKTGLYTIVVQDVDLNHTGTYNISFNKLPGPPRPGIYNPIPSSICGQPTDLMLDWEDVEDATGYDVYFGPNVLEPLQKVGDVTISNFPVADLDCSTIYYWKVVAHTTTGEIPGTVNWFGTRFIGDFDEDGDVDGSDLAVFAADFGKTNCGVPTTCPGDFDNDGDVDGSDLAVFAADFGRTDCP